MYGRRPNTIQHQRAIRDSTTRKAVAQQGPAAAFKAMNPPPARSRFSHRSGGPIQENVRVDGVPAHALAPGRREE